MYVDGICTGAGGLLCCGTDKGLNEPIELNAKRVNQMCSLSISPTSTLDTSLPRCVNVNCGMLECVFAIPKSYV